jgi:NAD+ synthase
VNTTAIIEHITGWISEYNENAGTKGFVIGVSGGIDSAVTSTLAARTGLELLCVEMPIHQEEDQVSRAAEHVGWLKNNYPNVKSTSVELTQVFESFIHSVPEVENEESRFMSLANTRARIRMTCLYYFAALHGKLVLGTGNKVEDFGVGFYTKYGDGGVDLSPIADLYKSEVYELGKTLGISSEILTAAPTDGLWGDDRTDEDQIGATYPELEWAMEYSAGRIFGEPNGRQKEVLAIYNRLHAMNQHKMQPIPVCSIPEALR